MIFLKAHVYQILTLFFLVLSTVAGGVLVKQNQDTRDQAQSPCTDGYVACTGSGGCAGQKYVNSRCDETPCSCSDGQQNVNTNPGSCGSVPNGGVAYDQNSRCTYTCNKGTWSSGYNCLPAGQAPSSAPVNTYLTNGSTGEVVASPGAWTSNGTTVSTSGSSQVANNKAEFEALCKKPNTTCKCECSTNSDLTFEGSNTAGGCYKNCKVVTSGTTYTGTCGQIDSYDANGNPTYSYNFSSCGNKATNPISTPVIQSTATPVPPTATRIPSQIPSPTPVPPTATRIPSKAPSPTIIPSPTKTPTLTLTPTQIPTSTPTIVKSCGSACTTNSQCSNGLICVESNDGTQRMCGKPELESRCSGNMSLSTCCTAPTNTPTPTSEPQATPTNTPKPTSTPKPTVTQAPVVLKCGQSGCDQANKSCQDGLICTQTDSGTYRCTKEELEPICKEKNSSTACCTLPTNTLAPKEPTPTRIILPKSGFEGPVFGLAIMGSILTLLGVLLVL